MRRDPDATDIDVRTDQMPPCGRCGGPTLLTVRVPHSLRRPDGVVIRGHRTAALCSQCDAEDPATSGVVAFFLVHESITAGTLTKAAPVIRQWIDHVVAHPPTYTNEDLDDEIALWCHDQEAGG